MAMEEQSCPRFAQGMATGMSPASVKEISGVVESQRNPGVLWVHNDAGDGPFLYAISTAGTLLGIYEVAGATAQDWEDIALGPGPMAGVSYLYVGDIGDNGEVRENITIYRVPEPSVPVEMPMTSETLTGAERITLVYPDKAHNSEAFMIDPLSGDLILVVKKSSGVSPVFRAAAPLRTDEPMRLEPLLTLQFGSEILPGNSSTTGGDISPRGDEIVIRTYNAAFLWRRPLGMPVSEALAQPPCPLPLEQERQGESLGFAQDGRGYYTISEGSSQPIYYYARMDGQRAAYLVAAGVIAGHR
jgi:hypothetical protein